MILIYHNKDRRKNKKLIQIILLVIVLTLSVAPIAAFAYTHIGTPASMTMYYREHVSLPAEFSSAVSKAATTWNSAPGSFRIYKDPNPTTGITDGDGINTVALADISIFSTTANAVTVKYSGTYSEFDVYFAYNKAWGNGNSPSFLDRQGIATHEFGHVCGLGEWGTSVGGLWPSEVPTMYAYSAAYYAGDLIPLSYDFRSLEADDRAGKSYVSSLIN